MMPASQQKIPYVGPRPFEEKDRFIFFGRDREARDLLSLIIAHSIVLVYAQSGTGKTSLINAKLIPMLRENEFEVLPIARVKGMTSKITKSQKISNIYTFNILMNWAEDKQAADTRKIAAMSLNSFLKERKHTIDDDGFPLPRAIIFDQFEEMFSLYQDRWKDRDEFFGQIRDALKDDPLLRVIIVMREDYIAQIDPYAPILPEKLRTRFHIERLRRDAALLAVTEPLKMTDRSFAEGVAEKLVEDLLKNKVVNGSGETVDVSGEFIETVQLQAVCQSLWRELPPNERQITFQHLETYGNVEQTLARFYDEAVRTAAKEANIDEERLRKWFSEILITTMGTRGMVPRGPELTGDIPNKAIDVLESKHLIRAESRAGAPWYELAHDGFIKPIQSSNKREASRKADQLIINGNEASLKGQYDIASESYHEALSIYKNVGESYRAAVGPKGTFLIMTYLILFSILLLYSLVLILSLPASNFASSVTFLLWGFSISDEMRVFLMVALAGALGSSIHTIRSFYWYAGNRELVWSWLSKYILLPFIGAALGLVFYLIIRGAFLSPQATVQQISPFGFMALAALAGLFSEQAVLKIVKVGEIFLTDEREK